RQPVRVPGHAQRPDVGQAIDDVAEHAAAGLPGRAGDRAAAQALRQRDRALVAADLDAGDVGAERAARVGEAHLDRAVTVVKAARQRERNARVGDRLPGADVVAGGVARVLGVAAAARD